MDSVSNSVIDNMLKLEVFKSLSEADNTEDKIKDLLRYQFYNKLFRGVYFYDNYKEKMYGKSIQ